MNNMNLSIEVLENVEALDWVDVAIGFGVGLGVGTIIGVIVVAT